VAGMTVNLVDSRATGPSITPAEALLTGSVFFDLFAD
jgi:hypothetical protein